MIITNFLKTLWPVTKENSQIVVSYIGSDNKLKSAHIPFSRIEEAAEIAHQWSDKKRNVYFGTCSRVEGLEPYSRGSMNDLNGIPGLWLDLDIRPLVQGKGYPTSEAGAVELLELFGLDPTLLVDSGSGFHVWWLFKEPLWFQPGVFNKLRELSENFQDKFRSLAKSKGYYIDKTSDLTRVLRLPGTINYKYSKEVKLVVDDGPRYTFEELYNFVYNKTTVVKTKTFWWPESCNPLVERLQKVTKEEGKKYINNLINRRPIDQEGNRDNAWQSVCSTIVFRSKGLNIPFEDWIELVRPSVEASQEGLSNTENPPPSLDDVIKKLDRAKKDFDYKEESRQQRDLEIQNGLAKKIRGGDSGLYTANEINQYAHEQGCSPEDLLSRLVIQKANAYYIFFEGKYEPPCIDKELTSKLPRCLVAFPGARLTTLTKDGAERPRTIPELIRDYCTVANDVVTRLPLQKSYFDTKTKLFYEAPCPLVPHKAEYSHEVDAWLKFLGGEASEKLMDWLACVTMLERPTCALYLSGARSTGKSMLTLGVASLWGKLPTEISKIAETFNYDLAKCPVVVADEFIPESVSTGKLRSWVAGYSQTLSRKYYPNTTLEGAIRLILCGNNDRLLQTGEDLDREDVNGTADRFLHIKVGDDAARYLKSLGGAQGTADWVSGGRIARHLTWLKENRKVSYGNRFLVEGYTTKMHQALATQDRVSNLVLEWISVYFAQTGTSFKKIQGVFCGNGKLALNSAVIKQFWEMFLHDNRLPTINMIGRALKRISIGSVKLFNLWYHEVDIDLLINWMLENQTGNVEDVLSRVNEQVDFVAPNKGLFSVDQKDMN